MTCKGRYKVREWSKIEERRDEETVKQKYIHCGLKNNSKTERLEST